MGMRLTVLNNGHIELLERMGDEQTIVDCARVSTGVRAENGRPPRELIQFLQGNGHGTPFEHVVFRFNIVAPIFVMRQWMRHRIGTFNEMSLRYRRADSKFYIPDDLPKEAVAHYVDVVERSINFYDAWYDRMCQEPDADRARAREIARNVLPVCTMTEVIWTVNLRSLINFISQRFSSDAQYEIRMYASALLSIVGKCFPSVDMLKKV